MDLAQIRELLKIVADSGVAEVEIEEDEFKLVVRKNAPTVMVQPPMVPSYNMGYPMPGYPPAATGNAPQQPTQPPPTSALNPTAPAPEQQVGEAGETAEADEEPRDANDLVVKAPIVGTFYRSPSPDDDVFVDEGDVVGPGDVLCIIEAMKLMNEIESEVTGVVKKVLAEDGQPVEYDQPLFILEAR